MTPVTTACPQRLESESVQEKKKKKKRGTVFQEKKRPGAGLERVDNDVAISLKKNVGG